ncbi:MAG: GFA family protein [Methylobacteriaceae bacterium]|nr:GFA family protein [Methylobacteriaceae bacterium]MBV9246895.1 GFA family protein [Methylobacteriaceae bacterium]MBV9635943.1 GFA family protein [Methylobacteriaceae bacterium]MBV9703478.1 GFA family protein [Methylobacteriaceae bacterium]
MPMTGGCQCGAVRYEISGDGLATYICHCCECRRQSASAFGISVIVAAKTFHCDRQKVKTWSRPADSGRMLDCSFCTECGSRLWHATPGSSTVSVKGGSLDHPIDLSRAIHIWTSRKLPGVIIPDDVAQFPFEPEEEPVAGSAKTTVPG